MHFNAVCAYLAFFLVSSACAAPHLEVRANSDTAVSPESSSKSLANSDTHVSSKPSSGVQESESRYEATFMATGRGSRARRITVTTDHDKRVAKLIQKAAKEKWGKVVKISEIDLFGEYYISNNDAIPFSLKAPFPECPCEGEAFYQTYDSEGKPKTGAGKIYSLNPRKVIYDTANKLWQQPSGVAAAPRSSSSPPAL
ncbi:hypothetical protein F5050DRAFT_1810390 [Lentinula boryana]|uniref:Uncharacterized protein n=1 Tax=Lentinula boryana TaxID=40481 RepID=A0ABQ8Q4Y4_9AGAR|nr:hypothetical protein F5050DRAFT_1810390 [Lentinula boryana]